MTDSDTLTLGIGLHHKSKLVLSQSVREKGYTKISEKIRDCANNTKLLLLSSHLMLCCSW